MATTKVQSELIVDDVALAGNPTTTTQSAGNNTTRIATTAFVTTAINNLINSAPGTLDTLDEIAAALNDDPSFTTTVNNAIATKLPLAGGTMTGNLTLQTAANPTITVLETGAGGVTVQGTGSGGRVYSNSGQSLLLGAGGQNTHLAISSNGRVSIGDTSTSANNLRLVNASSTELDFVCSNGKNFRLQSTNASAFSIIDKDASNANRFHIDTNGNIGVGTDSPSDKFVVQKDSANIEPMLVLKNDNTTADNGASIDFSGKDTGGNNITYARMTGKYINHATEKSNLIFTVRNDSGAFTEALKLNHDMRMILNGGTFSSLPTGSTLNVFGDGETLRLDGSGNTSKTIRFRNVSTSNPGIITADGSLKIQTEDAGTSININSIQHINYRTTDTNSTAGDHTFYSYNTAIFKLDGGNNYAELRGGSDVRMIFGSTGTPTNNTSNWIRGAGSNLMYNTPGVHIWELGGTPQMQVDSNGVLRVGQVATNSAPAYVRAAGTLILEGADANHRIIMRGYQNASGSVTGNQNYMEFYEYGSYAWYTNVNTSASSRTYGMSLYDNTLKIGDHSYNNTSGVIHYGGTGRTFMDMNYDSYGAEIILINNRTSGGEASVLQYRTNGTTEGSVRGNASGLVFHNNSDYRKKKQIRDLTGSLDVITSLQPRLYKYKAGFGKPTRDFVGFIAHEIQEKMPNLVDVEKDALYTQQDIDDGASHVKVGDPKYQTVAYSDNEMITRLVGAIKELKEENDALKTRIEALEA